MSVQADLIQTWFDTVFTWTVFTSTIWKNNRDTFSFHSWAVTRGVVSKVKWKTRISNSAPFYNYNPLNVFLFWTFSIICPKSFISHFSTPFSFILVLHFLFISFPAEITILSSLKSFTQMSNVINCVITFLTFGPIFSTFQQSHLVVHLVSSYTDGLCLVEIILVVWMAGCSILSCEASSEACKGPTTFQSEVVRLVLFLWKHTKRWITVRIHFNDRVSSSQDVFSVLIMTEQKSKEEEDDATHRHTVSETHSQTSALKSDDCWKTLLIIPELVSANLTWSAHFLIPNKNLDLVDFNVLYLILD